MDPHQVCSPQNITVSCTYAHMDNTPVRVSATTAHVSHFCLLFLMSFFFSFLRLRYTKIDYAHFAAYTFFFQNPSVCQQLVHMRINYSKRNLLRLHSFFEGDTWRSQ